MIGRKRIGKVPARSREEASIWTDNGTGAISLRPPIVPPKRVEINSAPVSDTAHEYVVRKSNPDAKD